MSVGRTGRTRLLGPGWTARVSQWMTRSQIKSIQRGTIALTAGNLTGTVTITAVVTANCVLTFLGVTSDTATANAERAEARVSLTNATTVTATRADSTDNALLSFEIMEYQPGVIKSVQRGTINIVTSTTDPITAVDTTKANLSFLGFTLDATAAATLRPDVMQPKLVLTNATTVTGSRNTSTGTCIVGYQVAERF